MGDTAQEAVGLKGQATVTLRGPDGAVKHQETVENLIVTAGLTAIISRLASSPGTAVPTHMAVGTGSTAPAAGNTTLGTEIDRNAVTSNTAATNVLTVVGDWAAGDATNAAIAEAGIFSASSAGTMFSRVTFTAVNKGALDTLNITWTYTLSAT